MHLTFELSLQVSKADVQATMAAFNSNFQAAASAQQQLKNAKSKLHQKKAKQRETPAFPFELIKKCASPSCASFFKSLKSSFA
jgi:hypothetical protein